MVPVLASLLWFDLLFWDDRFPAGQGLGTVIDGEEATAWSADEGTRWQRRVEARRGDVVPVIVEPVHTTLGRIPVRVHTSEAELVARWEEVPVDVAALGLAPPLEGADPVVRVGSLAPFEVEVDRGRGVVLRGSSRVGRDTFEAVAGMLVRQGDALYQVAVAEGDHLELRAVASRYDRARIPNPADRRFPAIVPLAALAAVLGATALRRRAGRGTDHPTR